MHAMLLAGLLTLVPAAPAVQDGDFIAKDFHFQDGSVLPEVRLHYRTLGRPERDAAGHVTNAVLLLHGTTITGQNFLAPSFAEELYGPGQPLDAAKYYVIIPDGLGRGGSSKPSDGLRLKFPHYGYRDVVAAQHLLVTRGLGVDHLRLVLGTSMGGMMTWLWGEAHPGMMDALMPIASQPAQISGRNQLLRSVVIQAIRTDPDWKGGDYTTPPTHWVNVMPVFNFMTASPVRLQEQAPTRPESIALYGRMVAAALKNYDANDALYWFESSFDYAPEAGLEGIKARLTAVNFADDQLNPPELGLMEKLVAKVPGGRFVLVPASATSLGHQSQVQAAVWKPYLEELLRPVR